MTSEGATDLRLQVGMDVSAIPGDPRGAGRYVIELVNALHRREQIGLHLQTRRADGGRWRSLAPGADVRPVVPDSRGRRLAWEQITSPRFVDRWGIAVHHGPHYTMPEVARVPKVVTVHDLTFFDHPEWHEKVKVAVFKRAIRTAAERAAAIVCVSAPTARRLTELLNPQATVHVVPHGIDHDLFRPARDTIETADDLRALAELGIRPPYAAFAATIEPRKDVATLIRAFDLVAPDQPDLQLVIGGGGGWGSGDVEAAFVASPWKERIIRTGYLDDNLLPALQRNAAAFVYAAFEEGFGLPVLEALASGAPVITSRDSVMHELAGDAAIVSSAGDPLELASAITSVLVEDPATTDARRSRGLTVASRFTWDENAVAHEAIYREVASTPSRRR